MTDSRRLHLVRDGFDWASLRFSGERILRKEVERDSAASQGIAPLGTLGQSIAARSLRVNKAITPQLAQLAEELQSQLKLPALISMAVFASSHLEVHAGPDSAIDNPSLLVSSAAAALPREEMAFLLARRLGSILLGHVEILETRAPESERARLLLRGLHRFQEMGCDRFGVLNCQSWEVAVRTIVRSTFGLCSTQIQLEPQAWTSVCLPEEEAMVSPREDDFVALRAVAMARFVEGKKYRLALDTRTLEVSSTVTSVPKVQEPSPKPVDKPASSKSRTTPEVAVSYRPLGGDPTVMEEILEWPGRESAQVQEPTLSAESVTEIRRSFSFPAAVWLASQRDRATDRQKQLLVEWFGQEALDEARSLYEKHGESIFANRCQDASATVQKLDRATRQEILGELCRYAMTDESDVQSVRPLLEQVANWLGLSHDDCAIHLAEHVEHDFANYAFHIGEEVDVHLDGAWHAGMVEALDAGELRIRFASSGKSLRMDPRADLIRPRAHRQAS